MPFCGGIAARGHLMCRACWSGVPTPLQAAVSRSWRAYRTKLAAGAAAQGRLAARKVYLNATQAAIDAAEASRP